LLAMAFLKQVFPQTTVTTLPATTVKFHAVTPVKIVGTSDYFFFEGFAGHKPGCFKVDTGRIDLSQCDKFVFEFAEYFEGNQNIPLYYIRRTDGLYLSFQLGGAAFVNKITGIQSRFQKWLISKVNSQFSIHPQNAYNLLLPLVPLSYGYSLKVFNDNKEMGFTGSPKIVATQSEFYIGQVSKKTANEPQKKSF
jgi:hypothetical protein